MRSSVQDFKDKLGTVEAKVKLVENIATEDKFVCGCCYDFNEVKTKLTDLDVRKENRVDSEDAVKTSDLNFSLLYELKAQDQRLRHNGYVHTRVNQSPNLRLLGRVKGIAQENLNNGCRRFMGSVVSKSFHVHCLHPQSPNDGFAHPAFKHDLKVSRHYSVLGEHAPDERLLVNIAVHDLPLIDGDPLPFVALRQKFGVHSPEGSPVFLPLFVASPQVRCFPENLFANVHGCVTDGNYNAKQFSKKCGGARVEATASLGVENFKDKLGTVKAKVKLVENIATENKFRNWCGNHLCIIDGQLPDDKMQVVKYQTPRSPVKSSHKGVTQRYQPQLQGKPIGDNAYICAGVQQGVGNNAQRGVTRRQKGHSYNGGRWRISDIVRNLQAHSNHPSKQANLVDGHPFGLHLLNVDGHITELLPNPPDQSATIFVNIHDLPLIDGYPLPFVALRQKFGVHSPEGSPVFLPLFVAGSQVGRFIENLLANVHDCITNGNYNASTRREGCKGVRVQAKEEDLGSLNSRAHTPTPADMQFLRGRKVAVIGVGNRMRGDDGVGSVIAERLQELARGNLLVIDAETVPENYLGVLLDSKPEFVLFVDAVDFGGEAGEWALVPLSALSDKVPTTHTVSLKLLGQVLESEGIECLLLAVQPKQIGFGAPMSEEVASAAERIVQMLAQVFGLTVSRPAEMSGEVHGDE